MVGILILWGTIAPEDQLDRWPRIKFVHHWSRHHILVLIVASGGLIAARWAINSFREYLTSPSFTTVTANGVLVEKANTNSLKRETLDSDEVAENFFSIAERDFENERFSEAEHEYRRSLEAYPSLSAYLNLGIVLRFLSKNEASELAFQSGLKIAREKHNRQAQVVILGNLGGLLARVGRPDQALSQLNEALALISPETHELTTALIYTALSIAYQVKGDLSKALYYGERASSLCEKNRAFVGVATANNILGIVHAEKGDWGTALKLFQSVNNTFEVYGYSMGVISSLNNMGLVYSNRGDYEEALLLYERALHRAEAIGSLSDQANAYSNIAVAQQEQGMFKESVASATRAADLFHSTGNRLGEAKALGNRGVTYRDQGELKKAGDDLDAAIKLFHGIRSLSGEAGALTQLCLVRLREKRLNDALALGETAVGLVGNNEGVQTKADASACIGLALIQERQFADGCGRLKQTIDDYRKLGLKSRDLQGYLEAYKSCVVHVK
jgi:tetratricopeptide (TPR) repeat protein